MSGGSKSGDPDKRAAFEAALEYGTHATLGVHLYARGEDNHTDKENDR